MGQMGFPLSICQIKIEGSFDIAMLETTKKRIPSATLRLLRAGSTRILVAGATTAGSE